MKKYHLLIAALFVCSGAALAQSVAGAGFVTGVVRDNYGDGLPDTSVTISNEAFGYERTVDTSDDGVFAVPSLPPGDGYKIKIERKDFNSWASPAFAVPAGEAVHFRIHLQPAAGFRQGGEPAGYSIEPGNIGITSQVDGRQIEDLPLRQRRIDWLVPLAPAITTDSSNQQPAVLGQPWGQTSLVDGLMVNDGFFTQPTPFPNQTSVEAVSEFQTLIANWPPALGPGGNGIINAVTRSGETAYHGEAYGFLRLPGLTARSRFAGESLLHGETDAGANIGGPISHKLFFFADFETLSGRFDAMNRITSQLIVDPTATTIPSANCKATVAQCAAASKYILPQLNVLVPLSDRWINGTARLDYHLDKENSFSLAGNVANSLVPNPLTVDQGAYNGGLLGINNTRNDSRYAVAAWTAALGGATNEVRLGEWQDRIFQPASTSDLSTGNLGVVVSGVPVGDPNPDSSLVSQHRYQAVENLLFSFGSHTIQGGVDWFHDRTYVDQLSNAGVYYYPSLTNFAEDLTTAGKKDYTLFTQSLGQPVRNYPLREIDVFLQDTWRARPNLTVTYGLRWDKPENPQPPQTNATYYQTGTIASPNLDLAPRVGLAWKFDEKTTFRAGYGYYFAPFTGQLIDALYLGNATSTANVAMVPAEAKNTLAFPNVFSSYSAIPAGFEALEYANGKLRNPHTQQINLSAERQLDSSTVVSLNLIDSRGFKLWTATDDNLIAPTGNITYTVDNASGGAVRTFVLPIYSARSNTSYSNLYDIANGGSSRYDAAALQLRRRMTSDLAVQASWTWSHSTDDVGGLIIPGGIPFVDTNSGFASNRGSSSFDQRQRLVFSAIWQPHPMKDNSALARYVVNGWQLSAIGVFASGSPVTPLVEANELTVSGVTPLYPNTLDGSGGWARVPFESVDAFRTGAEHNLDLRLTRPIPITERVRASLLFEVFNVLNSQWTTAVNADAFTASAGILKPVPGAGSPAAAASFEGTNARSAQAALRIVF